ncbi:ABC transporter permease [Frisingicoccus caecimuris]|uniref:Transport permease protein n=1 Tax=Frisingicoccus caecimuris TaxID=1796636 RepID=A0A4R2L8M9_9FIRM|nr:ABC transporter permease [Frisingicoccus caecimuris]MCR1919413.1 ABC transporter permease [Frisingicoccus caecimuris]TCO83989.1 ABC-2 type transport system permease protein [Frisingicoccus caecimuris]
MKHLREIYDYRQMIFSLVRKELRGRYKGSALGFLWTFINPLLQLCVYTFVFSIVMPNNIDKFYLYLFVGLIPWLFFSGSLTGGAASIINQKDMVKKIYFPREVMPIAYVTSNFVNMLLCFIVIFAVVIVTGGGINPIAICYLPVIMVVEYIMCLGGAMLTSALTVYFRDLEYILGIVTMAWMYFTPVVYSIDMVPENLRPFMNLNPMTPVIVAYRDVLYSKQVPHIRTLTSGFVLGCIVLIVGCVVFQKLQRGFAEEL